MKYETKYKVLYQILRQHIKERTKVPSSKVSSTEMYTTIGGSLMPTAPVCSDMRADLTLNVTTGVPTTVEGVEERESTQLTQDIEGRSTSTVVPPAREIPETSPKVIPDRSSQEELPSRNTISRENSRVDALAATRHFFGYCE